MAQPDDEVTRLADEAVAAFQTRAGGRLDFTQNSLAVIEEMLDEAAPFLSDLEPQHLQRLVQLMGCYILQVARRAYGGKVYWHEQREQPVLVVGEPEFRIALIAWDRVQKRLGGDPSDSVPFFFEGFADRVQHAKPGDDCLYV
jgi:hypothetical protein